MLAGLASLLNLWSARRLSHPPSTIVNRHRLVSTRVGGRILAGVPERPHENEPRVSAVTIRCTPTERRAIEQAAKTAGQTLSEYVLRQLGLRGPGKPTS
jgi:hypothetical protein